MKRKTKPRAGWKIQILNEININGLPEMLIPDTIQNDFDESETRPPGGLTFQSDGFGLASDDLVLPPNG